MSEYKHTKKGLTALIYNSQKGNSIKKGFNKVTYTLKELREWLYSQPAFHIMYDNWKRLDYQKDYRPSVDRKNDYIGYTMDNIQLMTWAENKAKYHQDSINGVNTKQCKEVVQLTKEGKYLATYHSVANAARETGCIRSHIVSCCTGNRKSTGGFKWRYSDVV